MDLTEELVASLKAQIKFLEGENQRLKAVPASSARMQHSNRDIFDEAARTIIARTLSNLELKDEKLIAIVRKVCAQRRSDIMESIDQVSSLLAHAGKDDYFVRTTVEHITSAVTSPSADNQMLEFAQSIRTLTLGEILEEVKREYPELIHA